MLPINLIFLVICAQIFHIHSSTIGHTQKNFWSDYDIQPNDEYLTKIFHKKNLFHKTIPLINTLKSTDEYSHGLQKRGRQCLWKVCSWALDKRSTPSKIIY